MVEYIGEVPIQHVKTVNPEGKTSKVKEWKGINKTTILTTKDIVGLNSVKIYGYAESVSGKTADESVEDMMALQFSDPAVCYYAGVEGFVDVESINVGDDTDAMGVIPYTIKGKVKAEVLYYETFDVHPAQVYTHDQVFLLPKRQAYLWNSQGYTLSLGHKIDDYLYAHLIPYVYEPRTLKCRYEKSMDRFKLKIFDGVKRVYNREHTFADNMIVENNTVRWNMTTGVLTSKVTGCSFTATIKPSNLVGAPSDFYIDSITPEEIRIICYVDNKASIVFIGLMNIKVFANGIEWGCAYSEETDMLSLTDDGDTVILHVDNIAATIVNGTLPSSTGFYEDGVFVLCHFKKHMDTDPLKTELQNMYIDTDKVITVNKYSDSLYMKSVGKLRYLSRRNDV